MKKIDTLVIATHNKGKLVEIHELVAPLGIKTISASDAGVDEPEETGATFAENAALKSNHSAKISGLPALADDSGLVVDALGGAPGIYSARWAGAGKDFNVAFARIERELMERKAKSPFKAHFVCMLALSYPDGETHLFEGKIHGHVMFPARGTNGFGYDPIFIPEGYDQSFAEIDSVTKQHISHRALAFEKFLQYIHQHV